jgi:hypothetical protein
MTMTPLKLLIEQEDCADKSKAIGWRLREVIREIVFCLLSGAKPSISSHKIVRKSDGEENVCDCPDITAQFAPRFQERSGGLRENND